MLKSVLFNTLGKRGSLAYSTRFFLSTSTCNCQCEPPTPSLSESSDSHDEVPDTKPKVGFIGLGNMGHHMGMNLIKNGYNLVVYDVYPEALKAFEDLGSTSAASPKMVAEQVDTIITMLPSSPDVYEAYNGDEGILRAVQPNTLMIDSSTIDPAASKDVAKLASEAGATYIDAPVSGGVVAARDGALTFMVGATPEDYERANIILENMAKNVVHCGSTGTGQAAKICNNMLLAVSMIGTAEVMNLGTRLGLDKKMLAHILNISTGRCWSSELYNPCPGVVEGVPSSNDYQGGFGTQLMTKDLGLAQNASTATKSATPMGSLAHQIYRVMCNRGYAKQDFSSVYKFLREDS